jgi:hydrogenase maturation protease
VKGKVLVAGIGNIFLGDDAFGVEVVKRLAQRRLPGNVCVKDFGIRSYDLAYALMEEWELVILVDAVPRGDGPGTVYTIEPDMSAITEEQASIDAHSMNPASVLQMVSALGGGKVGRMLVVGCEPGCLECDDGGQIGLSPPVEAAVDESIRVIEELIGSSGTTAA